MDAALIRRVCALLPMLGTSDEAEIVNTARTLTRVLREAGHSWMDVAAKLRPGPSAMLPTAPTPPNTARRQRSAWADDRDDVVRAHEADIGALDQWSADFLDSVHDQVLLQGRTLSEKQRTKLNEILDKLGV